MTMGERIRQARIDAGLSQRQLAGTNMTRNMLSALEHDGANPSVATLRYLSEKLCKPISYFLGEDVTQIRESEQMRQLRDAFRQGKYSECLDSLAALTAQDLMPERTLLEALCSLELAAQALAQGKGPYANRLLQRSMNAAQDNPYLGKDFERRWMILAAKAARGKQQTALVDKISDDDEVLCLKARSAMDKGDLDRAEKLLEAVARRDPDWNWLRGEVWFARKEYRQAIECYRRAEENRPQSVKRLEICYRELEDYKMAYYYATKKV